MIVMGYLFHTSRNQNHVLIFANQCGLLKKTCFVTWFERYYRWNMWIRNSLPFRITWDQPRFLMGSYCSVAIGFFYVLFYIMLFVTRLSLVFFVATCSVWLLLWIWRVLCYFRLFLVVILSFSLKTAVFYWNKVFC